jgi:AbrB family looped-hinge helix DNA binding protein
MKLFYTVTTKGQITILREVREQLGLKPGCRVSLTFDEATQLLRIQPMKNLKTTGRGQRQLTREEEPIRQLKPFRSARKRRRPPV